MEAGPRSANGGSFLAPQEGGAIHFPGIAELTDQLVNGITLGMLYILVALGLNIILGLMGVINFSHGAFFMLGAYLMFELNGRIGFWPAILAAAVVVGLLGMAFERVLVRPLYTRIPEYTPLLTFGTALIFTQIV